MARTDRKSQIAPTDRSDAVMNAGTGASPKGDLDATQPGENDILRESGLHGNVARQDPGNSRSALHTSQVDARRKGDVRTDHAIPFMRPNTVWDDAKNDNPYVDRRTKLGLPAATRGSTDVVENDQAGVNARRK